MVRKCSWKDAQKKRCKYIMGDDLRRYLVFSLIGTLLIAFGTVLLSFDSARGIIEQFDNIAPFSFVIFSIAIIVIGAYVSYLARRH